MQKAKKKVFINNNNNTIKQSPQSLNSSLGIISQHLNQQLNYNINNSRNKSIRRVMNIQKNQLQSEFEISNQKLKDIISMKSIQEQQAQKKLIEISYQWIPQNKQENLILTNTKMKFQGVLSKNKKGQKNQQLTLTKKISNGPNFKDTHIFSPRNVITEWGKQDDNFLNHYQQVNTPIQQNISNKKVLGTQKRLLSAIHNQKKTSQQRKQSRYKHQSSRCSRAEHQKKTISCMSKKKMLNQTQKNECKKNSQAVQPINMSDFINFGPGTPSYSKRPYSSYLSKFQQRQQNTEAIRNRIVPLHNSSNYYELQKNKFKAINIEQFSEQYIRQDFIEHKSLQLKQKNYNKIFQQNIEAIHDSNKNKIQLNICSIDLQKKKQNTEDIQQNTYQQNTQIKQINLQKIQKNDTRQIQQQKQSQIQMAKKNQEKIVNRQISPNKKIITKISNQNQIFSRLNFNAFLAGSKHQINNRIYSQTRNHSSNNINKKKFQINQISPQSFNKQSMMNILNIKFPVNSSKYSNNIRNIKQKIISGLSFSQPLKSPNNKKQIKQQGNLNFV